MQGLNLQFLNNIVKPWDELSELLAQRYAFQPDLSDVTRMASSIAVEIKHWAERESIPRKTVDNESAENKLMSDVADVAKHVNLRDKSRSNSLYVAALFEGNAAGQFRFIRNAVFIEHASEGELDFMIVSNSAIKYWIPRSSPTLNWQGIVRESLVEFHPSAFLHYNPKYCINMSSTRLKFFTRLEDGTLKAYDPPTVKFEVF